MICLKSVVYHFCINFCATPFPENKEDESPAKILIHECLPIKHFLYISNCACRIEVSRQCFLPVYSVVEQTFLPVSTIPGTKGQNK